MQDAAVLEMVVRLPVAWPLRPADVEARRKVSHLLEFLSVLDIQSFIPGNIWDLRILILLYISHLEGLYCCKQAHATCLQTDRRVGSPVKSTSFLAY